MNFTFMIPLSIVLIATYFLRKSEDEIVYLCGIVVIIGLVLSLILAPWQVQLFLLGVAAISTIKLGKQNQTLEIEVENKPPLLYRGSNYEHKSSNSGNAEVSEVDLERKYRGQVWKNHHSEAAKIPQTFQLTYRGASAECQKYVAPSDEQKNIDSPTHVNQER